MFKQYKKNYQKECILYSHASIKKANKAILDGISRLLAIAKRNLAKSMGPVVYIA